MADELTLTLRIAYAKGNVSESRSLTKKVTVSGTAIMKNVQNVGTSEETLDLGDVTLTGYAFLYNTDSTNYIEIGKATGNYFSKLKAGEFDLLRLDGLSNIYVKANTAPVDLEYILFSN